MEGFIHPTKIATLIKPKPKTVKLRLVMEEMAQAGPSIMIASFKEKYKPPIVSC